MNPSIDPGWVRVVLPVRLACLVAGVVFAGIAKSAGSRQVRFAWRLAAWITSARDTIR